MLPYRTLAVFFHNVQMVFSLEFMFFLKGDGLFWLIWNICIKVMEKEIRMCYDRDMERSCYRVV